MLALGEEQCTRLFAMMHEDEIKDISSAMSQLGAVRAEVVERLCVDFVDHMGAAGNLVGSYESTERLLQKSLPRDRASQIMEEIRGPAGRTMWDKLGNVHEAVLANYLKNEYPQTVAVVLSKVRADHAARVLTLLPDLVRHGSGDAHAAHGERAEGRARRRRTHAARRVHVQPGAQHAARRARDDGRHLQQPRSRSRRRASSPRWRSATAKSAERIKSLMFTFDDLIRLTPQAVQVLLRVDREGQAAGRAEGRVGEAPRHVLQEHVGARRQDAEGRYRRRLARCGCATWTRRRPASSRWPRNWRRKARSRSPKARTRRWLLRWTALLHAPQRAARRRRAVRRGLRSAGGRARARGDRAGVLRGRTGRRRARRHGATATRPVAGSRRQRRRGDATGAGGDRRAARRRSDAAAAHRRDNRPRRSPGCCWTAWRRRSRRCARATATRKCAPSSAPCCRR